MMPHNSSRRPEVVQREHTYINGVLHFKCSNPDCSRIDQWIPADAFYRQHRGDGYGHRCKRCQKLYNKQYREKHGNNVARKRRNEALREFSFGKGGAA